MDQFKTTPIHWDISVVGGNPRTGQLLMQPGYQFTFEATVEITPQYIVNLWHNIWSTKVISGWKVVVGQKTATKTPLDSFQKHSMRVRYIITLEPKATQRITSVNYGFKDFLDDLGSAVGIMGIGLVIMSLWLKVAPCFRPRKSKYLLEKEEERKFAFEKFLKKQRAVEKQQELELQQVEIEKPKDGQVLLVEPNNESKKAS